MLRSKIAPPHFNNDRCAFLHPIPAFVGRLDRFLIKKRTDRLAENGQPRQVSDDLAAIGKNILVLRSEEHTSELQSLMRTSYAVFCLKKKKHTQHIHDLLSTSTNN